MSDLLVTQQKVWQTNTLKDVITEVIYDPKFVGLSRHLKDIDVFWSREIPTACAGHGFIFFNPDFFDSIPPETRKTVIAHEIWHLILRHLERGKDFDPYTYNVAADHVINIGLSHDGFTFDGSDPCMDFKYTGMSTEQVYHDIYNKEPVDKSKHVSAETIEGLIEEALSELSSGKSLDQQKVASEKIVEALEQALGQEPGGEAGHNRIQLDHTNYKVITEGVTYEKIFKDYLIDPLGGKKRTFMRPSRRQMGMKNTALKLPGRLSHRGNNNRLTHLTYALDVSGSISHQMAQQFHDSIRSIKELLNPSKLTVLLFDTKIVFEQTYTDRQKYKDIVVNAGGGTSLEPVYLRAAQLNTEALVIFTDLQVGIPPKPTWDTIWIVPNTHISVPPNLYGSLYRIPSKL